MCGVYVKVILSIRLELSSFSSARFIRDRIFTQPEATIVTFILS